MPSLFLLIRDYPQNLTPSTCPKNAKPTPTTNRRTIQSNGVHFLRANK